MSDFQQQGTVRIADNVVATIASTAALETNGIAAMSGGIAEGIARRVSGRQAQKGVEVTIENDQTRIAVRVIVLFGQNIRTVCHHVQLNVKQAVEDMTGLHVENIHIRVEGVEMNMDDDGEQALFSPA